MKDKFILNDGTIIELEAGASISALTTIFADWNAAAEVMPKFTEKNLLYVTVQNGDVPLEWNYQDLVLQPGSWEVKADGVHVTISLREKTELEKRIEKIESSQEVQDGAIEELAGMVGGA